MLPEELLLQAEFNEREDYNRQWCWPASNAYEITHRSKSVQYWVRIEYEVVPINSSSPYVRFAHSPCLDHDSPLDWVTLATIFFIR